MLEWNSNYSGDSTPVEILVPHYSIWHFKHTNGFEIKLLAKDEPLPPGVLARQFTYLTTHSHRVVPVKEILSKMLFHTVLQSLENISRFSANVHLKVTHT